MLNVQVDGRLSRMKIRFLFEVCGTRTFFMTASCHQCGAAHNSHYDACRTNALNIYGNAMYFKGILTHFVIPINRYTSDG